MDNKHSGKHQTPPLVSLVHTAESQPFPEGTGTSVRYVGEGMANVVFSFPGAQEQLRDVLIRAPKDVTGDYGGIHKHWCQHIFPLFDPADLVPQYLVKLGAAGSESPVRLDALATELARVEHSGGRPTKFRGSKLKETTRDVMLIQDMRPRNGSEKLIEFKPKWLAQSPTAPPGAKRCRNCAREALRARQKGGGSKGETKPILCPLRLLDRDSPESMRIVCESLTDGQEAVFPEASAGLRGLREWLRANELLPRLRDAQVGNDGVGVLAPTDVFGLGRAMTLRDCTCYVRLTLGGEAEARLGDLDLKDQDTKLEYWRNMELELINDGWYTGTEEPRAVTHCLLEA